MLKGSTEAPRDSLVSVLIIEIPPRATPARTSQGDQILHSLKWGRDESCFAAGILIIMRESVKPARGTEQPGRADQELALNLGFMAVARAEVVRPFVPPTRDVHT